MSVQAGLSRNYSLDMEYIYSYNMDSLSGGIFLEQHPHTMILFRRMQFVPYMYKDAKQGRNYYKLQNIGRIHPSSYRYCRQINVSELKAANQQFGMTQVFVRGRLHRL